MQQYNWNAPEPDEATCNQTVHVKLESEVERLTSEVRRLKDQMAIDDLEHDELEDIQRIMLESDDDEDYADIMVPVPMISNIKTEPDDDFTLQFDGGSSFGGESDGNGNEQQQTNASSPSTQLVQIDGAEKNVASTSSQSALQQTVDNNVSSNTIAGTSSRSVTHSPQQANKTNDDQNNVPSNAIAIADTSSRSATHTPQQATKTNDNQNNVPSNAFGAVNSIFDPVAGYINVVTDVSFYL